MKSSTLHNKSYLHCVYDLVIVAVFLFCLAANSQFIYILAARYPFIAYPLLSVITNRSETSWLTVQTKHFCDLTLTGNLSWLYTSDTRRLWLRVFLIFMIRTMAASIWYWRSWNTLSVVLACSSTYEGQQTRMRPRGQQHNSNQNDRCARQYRFFHLDLVDFNPEEFVFEVIITWELVSIFYIFTLWDFGKDTRFPAGQRLQSPPQLTVLCKCLCIFIYLRIFCQIC